MPPPEDPGSRRPYTRRMPFLAAISGYYLILLIPAALAVVFVFILSRQKWERPKGDDPTEQSGDTSSGD